MDNTQKILDYLGTQLLGVLSYVNAAGKPQSALVAVTETEGLDLIFGTDKTSRKYQQILNNPHVAFVIGTDVEAGITVQYEGIATEVDGAELEKARDLHLKKNPQSKKFAFKDSQTFFTVKLTWVRYAAMNQQPPEIFELTFNK